MKNSIRNDDWQTLVSPIYEHRPSEQGVGLAGFTVQMPSEPFMNHIRFFDSSNREKKLAELDCLRNQILALLNGNHNKKINTRR